MNPLRIRVLLTCPTGATECLAKLREVLETIQTAGDSWPAVERWEQVLPRWFVAACANPMSAEEAQAYVERWRKLSKDEQCEATKNQRWSLPDWLYWMEPEHSVWRWIGATLGTSHDLEVTLAVDGWPVPLGAFDWLARAAGADDVKVMP